jgi:hypothetical protein
LVSFDCLCLLLLFLCLSLLPDFLDRDDSMAYLEGKSEGRASSGAWKLPHLT